MASFIRMMRGADIDEDDSEAQVFEKLLRMPVARQALNEALQTGIPAKSISAAPANQKAMERLVECMISVNQSRESSRTLMGKLRSVQRELRSNKAQCLEFEQELIKTKTQIAMDEEDKETLKQSNRRLKRLSMGMGAPVAPLTPVATPVATRVDPALIQANERLKATLKALAYQGTQLRKSTELLRKESNRMGSTLQSRLESVTKTLGERQKSLDDYEVKQKYQLAELDKNSVLCKSLKEKYSGAIEQNKQMVLNLQKLSDALIETSNEVKRGTKVNEILTTKVKSLQDKHGELMQGHKKLGEDLGRSIETWKQRYESETESRKRAETEVQLWKSKPVQRVDLGPIRDRIGALYTRLSESHKQLNETRQLTTYLSSKYSEKYTQQRRKSKETITTLTVSHHEKMEAMKQFIRNMEIDRDQTKLELEQEKAQVRRLSAGENNYRKSFGEKDAQLLHHKVALRDVINHYKHTNSELEVAREELAEIKRRDIEREVKRVMTLKVKNKRLSVRIGDIVNKFAAVRISQSAIRIRTLEWASSQVEAEKIQKFQLEESRTMATHLSANVERLKSALLTMSTIFKQSQVSQSERISCITSMSRGKIQALSDQLRQSTNENQIMQNNLRVSVEKMRSAQVAQAESLRRREFRQSLAVNEAGEQVARLKKATFLMSQRMATDVKALKQYQARLIECRDHYKDQARVQRDRVARMSDRLHFSHAHIKELKGLLEKFTVAYEAKKAVTDQTSSDLRKVTRSRDKLSFVLTHQVIPVLQAAMKSCRVTETIERATDLLKDTREELSMATQDLTIQQARCRHQTIQIQELEVAAVEDRKKYELILAEAADSKHHSEEMVGKEKLCEALDRLNEVNGRIKEMQGRIVGSIIPAINKKSALSSQIPELSKLQDSIVLLRSENAKARNQMLELLEKEKAEVKDRDKRIEVLDSRLEDTRLERDECVEKLRNSNYKAIAVKTQMSKILPSLTRTTVEKAKMAELVKKMSLLLQKLLRDQVESRRVTEKLGSELEHQKKTCECVEDVRRSLTEVDGLKMRLFGTVSQLKDRLDDLQISNMSVRAELEGRLEKADKNNKTALDMKLRGASERLREMMSEMALLRDQLGERVPNEQYQRLRETIAKMAGKMQDQIEIIKSDRAKLENATSATSKAIKKSRSYGKGTMTLISQLDQVKSAIKSRNTRVETGMSAVMDESHRSQEDMKEHFESLVNKFEAQKSEIVALKERLAYTETIVGDERGKEQLKVALGRIRKSTQQQKQLGNVMSALSQRVIKTTSEKRAIKEKLTQMMLAMQQVQQSADEGRRMTDSMALHCKLERTDLLAEVIGLQDDNRKIRAQIQRPGLSIPVRTAPADRLMIGEAKDVLGALLVAYKEKCEQLGRVKGEQEKIRALVPQMVSMTKQQLSISCTRQSALLERSKLSAQREPNTVFLDPQSDAVRMIIEDLADELAETQEELRAALQLCRVKLVEDMSFRKLNKNIAEQEFDGLCKLNQIERTHSTAPHKA